MQLSAAQTFDNLMSQPGTEELVAFLLALPKADLPAVRTQAIAAQQTYYYPTDEQSLKLFLAGLATYTRQEAFKTGFHWGGSLAHNFFARHKPQVHALLLHARPSWLTDWLLNRDGRSLVDYWQLRELEELGLIKHEPRQFAWKLVNLLGYVHLGARPAILEQLARDPRALTREIPAFFDFDCFLDRIGLPSRYGEPLKWDMALRDLAAAGHLDRQELLTRCLLALRRDFRRPLLTWFKNLFLSLKPTIAERLARQAELVELLAHPLPLVVNFALDQLKKVWLAPNFEVTSLLLAADPLLTRADLNTGLKTLLANLPRLLRRVPTQALAGARLLGSALAHREPAVQEQAAQGLAELLSAPQPLLTASELAEVRTLLADHAEWLGPAARAALAPWLTDPAPLPDTATYVPVTQFVPELSLATAIAPVADWHELLYLSGRVLRQDDPVTLERWLDGLLTLPDARPPGYQEQLQPFLRQLAPHLPSRTTLAELLAHFAEWPPCWDSGLYESLFLSWYEGFATARVSQVVLNREPNDWSAFPLASDPLSFVNQHRLAFVEALLAHQQALPLLSSFTHRPYYVSPAVLIEKLLTYQDRQATPNLADLTVALARTAFAGPAAATAGQQLAQLTHVGLRQLLAWYFSPAPASEAPPVELAAQSVVSWPQTLEEALPGLWAVAARTKYPTATWPWLAALEAAAHAALLAPAQRPPALDAPVGTQPSWVVAGLPLYAAHGALPQRQRGLEGWDGSHSLRMVYDQLHALVPQHPEPLYRHTLRCMRVADNLEAALPQLLTPALRTLLEPRRVLGEGATLLLASGLVHHQAACRSLAQEVLVRAIAHGRLVPGPLGRALGQQLAAGYVPVPRLTANLAALRGVDATTDEALRQVVDQLLPALPGAPLRNLRPLLDFYADLVARTRPPVPMAVRALLQAWRATPSLKKVTTAVAA